MRNPHDKGSGRGMPVQGGFHMAFGRPAGAGPQYNLKIQNGKMLGGSFLAFGFNLKKNWMKAEAEREKTHLSVIKKTSLIWFQSLMNSDSSILTIHV